MSILKLYPSPQEEMPLAGFYLILNLHRQAAAGDMLIYANYITSIDGRISIKNPESGEYEVPSAIANPRDWRLYQELAAQSDIMLTSARYFRQLARGQAQDLLPVGNEPAYADLRNWRREQGLKEQPDVAVLSNSLDIPLQALEKISDRNVLVFTHHHAADSKVQALERFGAQIFVAGDSVVEGNQLKQQLTECGYRSAYMIAGPAVFRTLIRAGVMNRLFLSTRYQILGGESFHTLMDGNLEQAEALHLLSLAVDLNAEYAQSFAQYAWDVS